VSLGTTSVVRPPCSYSTCTLPAPGPSAPGHYSARSGSQIGEPFGQIGSFNLCVNSPHVDAFQNILRFPDVARPVVVKQTIHRFLTDALHLLAVFCVQDADVVPHKMLNILTGSRNGSREMLATLKRKYRSLRKRFSATNVSSFLLVAATTQTFTDWVL
jgi:hypothetical protein